MADIRLGYAKQKIERLEADNERLSAVNAELVDALKDAAGAIMSIDIELFGRDPEVGYYYRDELMAMIDEILFKVEPAQ